VASWTRRRVAPDASLEELPLFSGCRHHDLKQLERLGTRLTVRAGKQLVTAGDPGREVVVVLSGDATCFVGDTEVACFGASDFFGEVATLDGGPRTATVVAATDMEILVLNRFEFELMIRSLPDVAHRMFCTMAQRLRHANLAAVF
jgi:CRP/FNR family cyclic AMP-dependent transcriptional regulator